MHAGEREPERDPDTGRIVKGRGRTPPKVIIMTLTRDLMRPTREARSVTPSKPSQKPEEIPPKPSLRGRHVRDRIRPPSKDADLHRGQHPLDAERQRMPPGLGRPSAPPPSEREGGPADGRPRQAADRDSPLERARLARIRARVEGIGRLLGMEPADVALAGRTDPDALRARVEAAGGVWETGRLRTPPPGRPAVLDARRTVGEALGTNAAAQESEEDRQRRLLAELDKAKADAAAVQVRREQEARREKARVAARNYAFANGIQYESGEQMEAIAARILSGDLVVPAARPKRNGG
jgi:hypothetical protein